MRSLQREASYNTSLRSIGKRLFLVTCWPGFQQNDAVGELMLA